MSKAIQAGEFETAIETLNKIVESLEAGNLNLEDALSQYEKAVNLVRHCQSTLDKAEQRIKILNDKNQLEDIIYDSDSSD